MNLPDISTVKALLPKDFVVTNAEIERLLDRAPKVLELMTEVPIRRSLKHEKLFMSSQPMTLSQFPVEEVKVEGGEITCTQRTGVVYPDLPPFNYAISYYVGYKPDSAPAIIANILQHLVLYQITKDPGLLEEVAAEIEVLRLGVRALKRERERDQAG